LRNTHRADAEVRADDRDVQIDRTVTKDGTVTIAGHQHTPPLLAGSIRAPTERARHRITVANQRIKLGPRHRGN
jgi:hypothetical protein